MRLDSNSRFIAGFCAAAVIVLVTWLHVSGEALDERAARCEPEVTSPSATQRGEVSLGGDDTPRSSARVVGTAQRF